MTGQEFSNLMKENGYNNTSLAERWGMTRQAIGNFCKAEKVSPVYVDAIKAIAYEKQASQLAGVIELFNQPKD